MKVRAGIWLAALLLAACSPNNDNKPALQQERSTMEKAKGLDSAQQQQAEQQKQELEKQTQ